jgi:5-enolpyruvylshikimate-3-phosphate synthase
MAEILRYTTYEIEGDWSGASNFLVAAAMFLATSWLRVLCAYSKQADRTVIDVLKMFGAAVSSVNESGVFCQEKRNVILSVLM